MKNIIKITLTLALSATGALVCAGAPAAAYQAPHAARAPIIDGSADDEIWQQAQWKGMNHTTVGEPPAQEDYRGRIKVVWDKEHLYLLAEIQDDVLIDRYADPLDRYWEDDCLEIFIDEDHSGGNHQFNHNAFAYHVGLDNQVADISYDRQPHLYNHHLHSVWKRRGDKVIWEVALKVYDDSYRDDQPGTPPVTLTAGKQLGFMVHYCDNDGSEARENFMGTEAIEPVNGSKDRGWIDAGTFGTLILSD